MDSLQLKELVNSTYERTPDHKSVMKELKKIDETITTERLEEERKIILKRLTQCLTIIWDREQENEWRKNRNKKKIALTLGYEWKLFQGWLFDPIKKPCIGESIIAQFGIRGANPEPPISDCLTCDNLSPNSKVAEEGRVQYKLSWLKGMPLTGSIAGGLGFSYNKGARQPFKASVVLSPEAEWLLVNKPNTPAISAFIQGNISVVGNLPNDWRIGIRFHLMGK